MSKNVTIFTGTFTKINGEKRTMNFIRQSNIPKNMLNSRIISEMQSKTGSEVVYDIDLRQFRLFNWNTLEGQVSERNTTFTF